MSVADRLPSTRLAEPVGLPLRAPIAPIVVDAEPGEQRTRRMREYLRNVYAYRWLCATGAGLGFAVAALFALVSPRLYTASTRLLVARQSPIQLRLEENVLRPDDMDRSGAAVSSFLATQVAVLSSRDLAERVIRSHHLADDATPLQRAPEPAGLLSLFRPRGWEAMRGPGRDPVVSGAPPPVAPRLLDRYMRYLAVQDVRGTDLVDVRFTTPSPELSAFLAAAHAQAYVEANEEARLATTATAKDFLGRQLRESRAQLERVQAALSGFAAAHPSVAVNQEQQVVVQRIAELSTLITKAEGTRIVLESRYDFLTRPGSDAAAYFVDRPGVQRLQQTLLEVQAERVALGHRLGPNHARMVELDRREGEVERQLAGEVERETAAVRGRHAAALVREEQLRRKLAEQEQSALELRDLGARYDRLKSDLQTAQALHESLLKQQMETAVNSDLAASNVRVVQRAEVPQRASRPNVSLLLTLGTLLGLGGAVGAAFACEHLHGGLKSGDEVEAILQVPLLATIVNFDLARRAGRRALGPPPARAGDASGVETDRQREIFVLREPTSVVAEAFRTLRSAVLFSAAATPPKVIVVTSAVAGEGKTVSCLNLAAALAEAGARVLLIDADMRHPGCHVSLGVAQEPGLSTFLAGQTDLAGVIRRLAAPRLAFIPAGRTPANPAALVGSARMREALEEMAESYDFVVIDSPPVLPVADAVVLGREADGVVLVAKGHDTAREILVRARDRLLRANVTLLGAAINNVDPGWSEAYLYRGYGEPTEACA